MTSLSKEKYNPEDYLLDTLNNLDIGFVKVSDDGIILNHNLTFNKIFGYNPEKNLIDTKTLDYWLNSEEMNKFREVLYKNGIVKKYIAPAKKLDGEKIFLQMNIKLNKNSKGEIISSEGNFVDVTEHIRTEQKLSKSEMNYKNLIEHLGMFLMIIDRDEIFQVVNEKAAESMGGKPTDFIGKSLNDVFPKDIAEKYIKMHQDIFKSGKGITFEHTLNLPIGTRTFYTSEQPVKDMQGNIISVLIISLDVTEPKIIKQKLKESEEKYKSERDNLLNILNSMKDGVYITNKNFDIEYINPALIKEFGPSKGKKCYEYTQSCSEPCPWCTFPEILNGNTIRSEWYSFKNHKMYDKIDTPLRKSDGTISMLKIFRDITDSKKAEELIKKENEKLKELDKIKNDFIIRASYEFKNPLISINNASEILLNYYKDKVDERALRLIKVINEGGERLYNLIRDIVDITRIKSKKIKLKLEKINITKLLHECISDLSFLALQRDIFLNIVINNNVYLFVDQDRIKQVIREMILNGINNSPPGKIVSITLQEFNDCVKIIIKDNGVGFTEDEKKKVFKKFGKIERHGKNLNIITTGMGLGLYLSKKFILLHGGTIRLESKGRNEGSVFIINLPKIFNQ